MTKHVTQQPVWVIVKDKEPPPEVVAALEYLAALSRKADEIFVYVGGVKP